MNLYIYLPLSRMGISIAASAMLYLLTGVGLALFVVAVAALIALVRSGQLDDLDTPPARMLADDLPPAQPSASSLQPSAPKHP
jgi:nitrogen fixation-related uncharacterized protein